MRHSRFCVALIPNKNEEERCVIIESMMCERYQSTLRESGLSPDECKRVGLEGRGRIHQGFECWKSFAAECSTNKLSSSSAAHSASEQRHFELAPFVKRDMPAYK